MLVLAVFSLSLLPVLPACSTLRAGIYIMQAEFDGDMILEKEPEVRSFLENMYEFSETYSIKAYERRAISYKLEKTEKMIHGFYVITDDKEQYSTLSFSGTKKAFSSQGAWVLNSDSDIESFEKYTQLDNIWDVKEIESGNAIDVKKTTANILVNMNSDATYYYNSHIRKRVNQNSCISALTETIALSNF
jgi:hypothetical protein